MQSNNSLKIHMFVLGIFGITFFLSFIFLSTYLRKTNIPFSAVIDKSIDIKSNFEIGLPVRLKIPMISVDADIEHLGLKPNGSIGVPKGPGDVAWFNQSSRPGEIGNSIIMGHSGWLNSIPTIFDNLDKLQKGDRLYVEDDKGRMITFIVRETQLYNENDNASSVFISDDKKIHLNLITCEGKWNAIEQSYSKRLVVFTDKAD